MRTFLNVLTEIDAYHGSSETEPVFGASHTGNNSHTFGAYQSTRHGIFFSGNKKFAALYGKVGRYRLNVKHTVDLENDHNAIYNFVHSLDAFDPDERQLFLDARAMMYDNHYWQLFEDEVGERFVAYLTAHGFDSAAFRESNSEGGTEFESRTTVVFDPKKIKRISQKTSAPG